MSDIVKRISALQGPPGPSAYATAVAGGYQGTAEQFAAAIAAAASGVAGVSISEDAGNGLEIRADGLFVPPPQLQSEQW